MSEREFEGETGGSDSDEKSDLPLPKRPENHIVESDSETIFRSLLPREWLVKDARQPDYGIDLQIEWTGGNVMSAMTGLIQLKGTHSIPWNSKGECFRSDIETSTSNYWLQQDLPVFIVLVDLSEKRAFYSVAKTQIREQYAKLRKDKSISYKFTKDHAEFIEGHYPFYADFFHERKLKDRDAAIRELSRFQADFFEFHLANYQHEGYMQVDSEEKIRCLFDFLADAEKMASPLRTRLMLYTDHEKIYPIWKKERRYPGTMTQWDMTLWLDQIDATLTQLIRRTKGVVLNWEKDYWAVVDPTLVERVANLKSHSAQANTRDARKLPNPWRR
jgi:Domain of unknown function (DUF4365)